MRIDGYSFGRMVIDATPYDTDLIIYSDRVRDAWWRKDDHRLDVKDLAEVIAARPRLLVVGTGYYGRVVVPPETIQALQGWGIELQSAPTGEAVRIFNEKAESNGVVGAFHVSC